jgi:hypothetical protein
LDIYRDQVDPDHQIHDYNHNNVPGGIFWTVAIPSESVDMNLGRATASYHLTNHEIDDYHDIINALMHGPDVPATVSFRIEWSGVLRRVKIRDRENDFGGEFIEDRSTIEWSSDQEGFSFVSDPASTSVNEFSVIGQERNGVFFHS